MEKYLIWDFGTQFAREPILRSMQDGTLICAFLTGGPREPHNDNVVMIAQSKDRGKTWSQPKVVFKHSNRGVWCTEIFTHGQYPLLVVLTYDANSHYRELQLFRSFSFDNGQTWTEPCSFPSGLNNITLRQGIVMSNNEWLFPLYWQEVERDFDWQENPGIIPPDEKGNRWPFCCGVAISSDCGQSYQRYGYIKDWEHHRCLWEPNVVEVSPGHVIMLIRDGNQPFLRRSESFDYGRTWSEATYTDIPNPMTKITLLSIGGKTLLINNFNGVAGWKHRTHLEIRVSEDGLKSFSKILQLEAPDKRFFYPHAFSCDEEKILYVAYENSFQHYLCRIPYSELEL